MFLPAFRTYFTMVLYVNGGRSSSSLSIFFSEGQNLNFSSFSLTRSKSRFASSTKCSCGRLIILIILPAIVCTHFTLHKKKINKGLQSLRQKKKNETKVKGTLKFSSVFNHLKQRVAYLATNWAFTVNPFRLTFFLKRISFNSFTCIFSTGLSIMDLILFGKKSI